MMSKLMGGPLIQKPSCIPQPKNKTNMILPTAFPQTTYSIWSSYAKVKKESGNLPKPFT